MKKSLLMSFVALMLTAAFAFGQNTLNVGSAEGEAGSEVSVAVTVSSSVAVAGASFTVTFDQASLQVASVANGSAATAMTQVGTDVSGANGSGSLVISLVDFSFSNPIAAGTDQEVFVINFTIADGASGSLDLGLADVSLSDASAGNIDVTTNGGMVTVSGGETPPPTTGGGENMLKVTDASGEAGAEVAVQVLLDNDVAVAGASFSVNFDASVLQVASVANGSASTAMTQVGTDIAGANESGKLVISLVDFSFSNPIAAGADQEVFVVNFTIASGAATGSSSLELSDVSLSDAAAGDVAASLQNGTVTITGGSEPPPTTGGDENMLWLTDASVEAGSEVDVNVLLTNTVAVAGASFTITFDQTKLQVVSADNGSVTTAMTQVGTDIAGANTSGSLVISLVDFSFSNAIAVGEDQEVLVVKFNAIADAAASVDLGLTDVSMSDPSAGDVAVTSTGSVVTITGGGTVEPPSGPEPSSTENFVYVLPVEGDPGTTASATIGMNNIVAVAGLTFNVNFDPAVIQLTAAAPTGKAAGLTPVGLDVAGANSTGVLQVSLVDFTFSNAVAVGLADIFKMDFNFVSGSAASLAATAEFTITDVTASDAAAGNIDVSVWSGTPTDGEDVVNPSLPKAYALSQNSPNPFNPSTTISYEVKADGAAVQQVSLNVYNIRGQLVRTLVNDQKTAGRYTIQWNGQDNNGSQLSSGVYFYRMQTGDFQQTRKMVLLK